MHPMAWGFPALADERKGRSATRSGGRLRRDIERARKTAIEALCPWKAGQIAREIGGTQQQIYR
jgi:hypothetical protein